MRWSAQQYLAFEDERTRPVRDLLNGVPPTEMRRAADLGCGPGNSTEVLAARFPAATVIGLDSSSEMIAAARARMPDTQFVEAALESWEDPFTYDLLLANAVLQWLPEHPALLPRLVGKLAEGGSLAVQMPDNTDEPTHRLMRRVATEGPWAERLTEAVGTRVPLDTPDGYFRRLRPLCRRVDIWRTIYHHPLAGGADGIIEWFKGTALRPLLAPLDDAEQQDFLARYRALLAEAYPLQPDGSVLLPFPRLFIVATR